MLEQAILASLIARYVRALGEGVAVEEIRAELAAVKLREQVLRAEIAGLSSARGMVAVDGAALRRRLGEWHNLLGQGPQVARQLLRKLLPEHEGRRAIGLQPTPEGVRFRGRAAWGALLSGVVQGIGLVVPPAGLVVAWRTPLAVPFVGRVVVAAG